MSIRSYVRSTDCHRKPYGQNLTAGIDISVVDCPAFWTFPLSDIQFKSRTGKLSISPISFLFKIGIFSSFSPEVFKRFAQMAQRLLKWHTTNLVQKRKLRLFFPKSQHRGGFAIPYSLLSLIPPLGTSRQSLVVNQTNTPHCPCQEFFLFGRWVKPVFIGAFSHLQHLIQQLSHSSKFNLKNMFQKLKLFARVALLHARLTPIPPTASLPCKRASLGVLDEFNS